MPLYKPSELLQFLRELGIQPKKALSQNFLIDGNIIRKIIASAEIKKGDKIVEIGPGPGSLTEALLGAGAEVIAIEKDDLLAQALFRLKGPDHHLDIIHSDILALSLDDLLKNSLKPNQKAKVIANLPYHITTPIIAKLIELRDVISEIVIMVQDEVAKRFVGKPSTPEYGSLTVFLNFYSTPTYLFKVSRQCFYPVPNVDSAIVQIKLKEPPSVSDESKFFQMTRRAFEQRRKMLRTSLKELYPSDLIEEALKKIGKSPLARPEELSITDLLFVFESLQ
jgi:16S rRNA (adenine1518-N6/adenine1519-N6)-dimethyltransferase